MGDLPVSSGSLIKASVKGRESPIYGIDIHGSRDCDGWASIGPKNDYGDSGILLDVYDFGFPISVHVNSVQSDTIFHRVEPINEAHQISVSEYCLHLENSKRELVERTKNGGLAAACFSARAKYVEGVIKKIQEKQKESDFPHYKIASSTPGTGMYVVCTATSNVMSDRNSLDPSKAALEGLIVEPRIHPANLAIVLQQFFPDSFGKVVSLQSPDNCKGMTWGSRRGNVDNRGYFVYEIPEEGTVFINNPRVLTLR